LCREIRLRLPDLAYSVSVTTRPPRPGEIDGADFRFVGVSEFQAMLARGEFAEWATVHGNLYGTRARALEDALATGRDVLLDIDTQGAAQLRARYPDAVLIFILAPSVKELEQRRREWRAGTRSRPAARWRRLRRPRSSTASKTRATRPRHEPRWPRPDSGRHRVDRRLQGGVPAARADPARRLGHGLSLRARPGVRRPAHVPHPVGAPRALEPLRSAERRRRRARGARR